MIPALVKHVDGVAWATPQWPILLPAAGAVAALFLLISAFFVPKEREGLPWAGAGALVLTFFWAPLLAAAPAFVWGPKGSDGAGPQAASLFIDLLVGDVVFSLFGLLFLGVAAAIWLGRGAGGYPLGATLAAFAIAGIAGGVGHGIWLRRVGALPGIQAELPARIHVGRAIDVPVTLAGVDPAGWIAPALSVRPRASGPVTAEVRVSTRGFEGTRTLTATAGEDRFAREVAIAVGDTWVLEETTTWHDHYLWFVSSRGRAVGPRTVVRVTGTREREGMRVYVVEASDGESSREWEVFAWDGEALAFVVRDSTEILEVGPASPAVPFFQMDESVVAEDGTSACTFAALPGGCRCFRTPPGGPLALAGPARCEWSTGNAVSTGVSAFLAVVTLGLVLEDPDREKRLEVVASGRGIDVTPPTPTP